MDDAQVMRANPSAGEHMGSVAAEGVGGLEAPKNDMGGGGGGLSPSQPNNGCFTIVINWGLLVNLFNYDPENRPISVTGSHRNVANG